MCLLISVVHGEGGGAHFSTELVAPLGHALEQCCANTPPLGPLVYREPGQENARDLLRTVAVAESLGHIIAGVCGRRDGVIAGNDIILGGDVHDGVVGLLALPCVTPEPVIQLSGPTVETNRDILVDEALWRLESSGAHDSSSRSMHVPKGEGRFYRQAK